MYVLDGASEKSRADHTLRDLGGFLGAGFGLEVQEGEIDVSLEVRTEPGLEVGTLG